MDWMRCEIVEVIPGKVSRKKKGESGREERDRRN
jgi:hypothetical protein